MKKDSETMLIFLRGALAVSWIALIMIFSTQAGGESSALSGNLSAFIIQTIEIVQPNFSNIIDPEAFEGTLRFWAHFFVYFVLALWIYDFLSSFYADYFRLIVETSMIALLIAIIDEVIQSNVPGRAMQIGDIYTDFFGALLATFMMSYIFYKMKRVS